MASDMPRKNLEISTEFPYHCVNRLQNKIFYPPEKMNEIWNIYQQALHRVSIIYCARVHLFILMSNHFHLLLSTPEGNISQIMQDFQSHVSIEVRSLLRREEYKFSSRYKWKITKTPRNFAQVYKYILNNPIEAKIVEQTEQYQYSSFSFQCNASQTSFEAPIFEFNYHELWQYIDEDIIERRQWLQSI
jgi:putative transposase